MFGLVKPIGIVCHDAGGSNQIIYMLSQIGVDDVTCYLEGPALGIRENYFPGIKKVESLKYLLIDCATLITGTGWVSDLEHNARKAAKKSKIHSIAVLDNWANYQERFIRNGETVFPDEIWVVDKYALEIARKVFPHIKIKLKRDYYMQQQINIILPLKNAKNELLYLLEPARSNWGRNEPGEFQALRYFFERLPLLCLPKDTTIRLRPHPSDSVEKYNNFLLKENSPPVVLDSRDLTDSISSARWVAGTQTYALTLALNTGRAVYCTLPPWAPPSVFPHEGLIHLKDYSIR